MSLSLTLDYAISEIDEPGFWRFYSTRLLAERGNAADSDSVKGLFRDEATRTLMLRPLQLRSDYLNTSQPLDDGSIIRLGSMNVNATDITNSNIFEAPVGNNTNPWIWHVPVGPSVFFPAAVNPNPGSPPSVVGVSVPFDLTPITPITSTNDVVYEVPTTMPAFGAEPTPTLIGDTDDGKWICHTADRLPANAAMFFQWHTPDSRAGFPVLYVILVGQYGLVIKDVSVQVFRDISPGGDRTLWKKIQTCPLWSLNGPTIPGDGPFGWGVRLGLALGEVLFPAHDRSLLWLPYRRNQILLRANTGAEAVITTRPKARRLDDNSDWDITREDTVAVWVMTPAPGRFQIQRVKYPANTHTVQSPTATVDYTPTVAPTITLTEDSDHGATLTSTRTQPPSYTLPVNDNNDCPTPTTGGTGQARTYGVELEFEASGDGRWTPFFYGFQIATTRTFRTRPTTPVSVGNVSSATFYLEDAKINLGLKPGDGRMVARVVDKTPFTLAPFYYRSGLPVQLKDGAAVYFTGWAEPNDLTSIKESTAVPRRLVISALDRWKQLTETVLRDQRDWTGTGHISVVLDIMRQAGIDTTGAETPPLTPAYNTLLGLGESNVNQKTGVLKQPWKPEDEDTAASYIERIAKLFSGWDVGFRSTGVPFYLPRDYYTTPTATFSATNPTTPRILGEVNFHTIKPGANQVLVSAANDRDGTVMYSSLWVDWASIRNPLAVNYLGSRATLYLPLSGTYSCAQLNWIARTIFQRNRRRRRTAEFTADYVPGLEVGHVCTLASYGDFRVQSIGARFVKGNWTPAEYTVELIETGYGV